MTAIAQMNWGRMKYAPDDPRLMPFMGELDRVYGLAEAHPGFLWRMADEEVARQLAELGHDDRMSATVSTWKSIADLKDYTFNSDHGVFLKRASEWFEPLPGPRLVIWGATDDARPDFREAFERLDHLSRYGDSDFAYGWPVD